MTEPRSSPQFAGAGDDVAVVDDEGARRVVHDGGGDGVGGDDDEVGAVMAWNNRSRSMIKAGETLVIYQPRPAPMEDGAR